VHNSWLVGRVAFVLSIDKNHQEKGRQERGGEASGPCPASAGR
jgi:hypothetical protein